MEGAEEAAAPSHVIEGKTIVAENIQLFGMNPSDPLLIYDRDIYSSMRESEVGE